MNILSYLMENLDEGYSDVERVAYSVIHANCRHDKDLESHYEDILQTIIKDWLTFQVDESMHHGQVIKYSQHRARHSLQDYLAHYKLALHIPRTQKNLKDNNFKALEYSDLDFEQRIGDNHDTSPTTWLRSAEYLEVSLKEAWEIWLLSEGFSVKQVAIILNHIPRTIYKHLNAIKMRYADV